MILIGRPYWRQVDSSWMHIWMLASPVTQHTSASGCASCTPIAAGSPKPMVPRPPELIQRRGRSNLYSCATHIWCWPTSEVTKAAPSVRRYRRSTTYCGLIGPSGSCR